MTAPYTLTALGGVIRTSDGACIPSDPSNADWQAYLSWLAAGSTPDPAPVEAPPVPSCQLWQLQALMSPAQWSQVADAVTSLNNAAVSAFFAHGTNVIPANSTTLLELGQAIGLTADQVAALVSQAAAVSIP